MSFAQKVCYFKCWCDVAARSVKWMQRLTKDHTISMIILGQAALLEMITRTILYYMFYFNITFILYILDFQIISIHCLSSCINVCLTAFQSTFLLIHCMCKLIIYDLIDRAVFAFKETV